MRQSYRYSVTQTAKVVSKTLGMSYKKLKVFHKHLECLTKS